MAQMLFVRVCRACRRRRLIVGRAIVRDALDGDDAKRLMSNISMIFGVATAMCADYRGWILAGAIGRRFSGPVGIQSASVIRDDVYLAESHPPEKRRR